VPASAPRRPLAEYLAELYEMRMTAKHFWRTDKLFCTDERDARRSPRLESLKRTSRTDAHRPFRTELVSVTSTAEEGDGAGRRASGRLAVGG
jgi:hypothetical protein